MGETVVRMFNELNKGPRAIRETLRRYCGEEKQEEWLCELEREAANVIRGRLQ